MSRFLINSQSALLIILWDFSMFAHLSFIRCFAATAYAEVNSHTHQLIFDIGFCLTFLLFPLLGLLADIKG